jgi:tetratricopeptide (TPR) repeat protein
LNNDVRGELDWIVMKALEKDRSRRYETASGLARDVERYMSDEPVSACPPSAAYRFRKFARRNSAAVITATAVLVSLLVLLVGLVVSNRMIAASQNETAEALRQKGLALSAAEASAEHADAQRRIAEENLRKARYESAVRELGQQSLTGNFEDAAARVRECIATFQALKRECPTEPAYGQQLAWSHVILARILGNAGQPHDAQAAAQQALELYEPLLATTPVVADQVHGAMVAYRIKGRVLREDGRLDEAERVLQRAVALHELHPTAATPADVSMREGVARVYFDLGDLRVATAQMRDAANLYARGLKIYPDQHWQWYQLAALYLSVGDVAHYRSVCREMLDRFEKRAETVPQIAEITAKTCSLVPQAVPDVSRVERLVDRMMSETEHTYFRHFILAKGLVDYRAGRHEQAVEALQRYAPNTGGTHWDATAFAALAMAQHRNGDAPQARASLDAARAIIGRKPPDAMRGDYWFDWLHCEILLREAEQLLAERKEASN